MIPRAVKILLKTRSNIATFFRIRLSTARSSNNNKLLIMLSYTTYKNFTYKLLALYPSGFLSS